jgi:hypothetical protein
VIELKERRCLEIENGNVTELHVHSIDRLGKKNTIDILSTINLITSMVAMLLQKEGLQMLIDGKENQLQNDDWYFIDIVR